MNDLVPTKAVRTSVSISGSVVIPAAIAGAGDHAVRRFLEFFAATIRNRNTREAYYRAACSFFAWLEQPAPAGRSETCAAIGHFPMLPRSWAGLSRNHVSVLVQEGCLRCGGRRSVVFLALGTFNEGRRVPPVHQPYP
jgi:hypothetical protein